MHRHLVRERRPATINRFCLTSLDVLSLRGAAAGNSSGLKISVEVDGHKTEPRAGYALGVLQVSCLNLYALRAARGVGGWGAARIGLTKLYFIGHGLMENRHGLLVDTCLTPADGHAERVAALAMIEPHADRPRAITLGADKAYDAEDFVNELRSMTVTPHVVFAIIYPC
jgi:hypothetical protein